MVKSIKVTYKKSVVRKLRITVHVFLYYKLYYSMLFVHYNEDRVHCKCVLSLDLEITSIAVSWICGIYINRKNGQKLQTIMALLPQLI